MKKIYDEIYNSNGQTSRSIWYSELEMGLKDEYGILFEISDKLQDTILETVKNDLVTSKNISEINWYFYDIVTSKDAIEDNIRSVIMIKKLDGKFYSHFNFSDYNFAVNLKKILEQKRDLYEKLRKVY